MKQLILPLLSILISYQTVTSQSIIKPATPGFDEVHEGISLGKIDTIVYNSTTVSTKRKAIIYTPPGFSKKKNIPFYIFYMALEEMRKNGYMAVALK